MFLFLEVGFSDLLPNVSIRLVGYDLSGTIQCSIISLSLIDRIYGRNQQFEHDMNIPLRREQICTTYHKNLSSQQRQQQCMSFRCVGLVIRSKGFVPNGNQAKSCGDIVLWTDQIYELN